MATKNDWSNHKDKNQAKKKNAGARSVRCSVQASVKKVNQTTRPGGLRGAQSLVQTELCTFRSRLEPDSS